MKDISEEKSATKGVGLYRVVGKWHFLAGLLMIHRTLRGDPSRALAGAGLLQPRRNGAMVPGGLALAAVIVTLGFVGLLAMVPISTAYGWGKCGREGETTCTYPNTGPVIMRYGQTSGQGTELKDQWYWSYHDGRVKIRCDNAFGDPHHGVDKVCEVLPIEAKDFAPITGYKRCSNLYGTCNVGGTPDQPRWVRYGNAESGWSYGLAAGSVKCDWDMVGDALWGSGLPGYCEVGPAHNLLNEAKDWQFCASENQACTVKPDGRPVTLRFGDARNAIYRVFDSANAPATLACNNGIIGYDPAPGQAKFCHFSAGKTVVEKMVGRWELVKASASPGDMTYAINIGVNRSSSQSSTQSYSLAVTQAITVGKEASLVKSETSITAAMSQSKTDSSSLGRSSSIESSDTCKSSTAAPSRKALYQWVIDVTERCIGTAQCPSKISTNYVVCVENLTMPAKTFKPVCNAGCCANAYCTQCFKEPSCELINPQFAAEPAWIKPGVMGKPLPPRQ